MKHCPSVQQKLTSNNNCKESYERKVVKMYREKSRIVTSKQVTVLLIFPSFTSNGLIFLFCRSNVQTLNVFLQ